MIRYSHALKFVPFLKDSKAAKAFMKVSWVRSWASCGLRVIFIAAPYIWSRNGNASSLNLARRVLVSLTLSDLTLGAALSPGRFRVSTVGKRASLLQTASLTELPVE